MFDNIRYVLRDLTSRMSSYIVNLRVIEKNLAWAYRFPSEDQTLIAERLFEYQQYIAFLEGGGSSESLLTNAEIDALLVEGHHNCERLAVQATATGGRYRNDPALNLASTAQGLFNETMMARRLPTHENQLQRINSLITNFVEANVTSQRRDEIKTKMRTLFADFKKTDAIAD